MSEVLDKPEVQKIYIDARGPRFSATLTTLVLATALVTQNKWVLVAQGLVFLIGATRGTSFDLYVDNTAGASVVTIAVATNGILSSAAADTPGSFGDLTIAAGATGLARFTIMFSSATAYVFTRTA